MGCTADDAPQSRGWHLGLNGLSALESTEPRPRHARAMVSHEA
jgi:hypothetical protein